MKKIKKILLIVGITMLLAVIGAFSVSAKEIYTSAEKDNAQYYTVGDYFENVDTSSVNDLGYLYIIIPQSLNTSLADCKIIYFDGDQFNYLAKVNITAQTDLMVDFLISNWAQYGKGELNLDNLFNSFNYYCTNKGITPIYNGEDVVGYNSISDDFGYIDDIQVQSISDMNMTYAQLIAESYGCDVSSVEYAMGATSDLSELSSDYYIDDDFESFFKEYYKEKLTQIEINKLNSVISEKNAVITENDSTISRLESQNNKLEMNVAGLNSQVSALVEDRTELNAQIKSLENQMQLKINKAYAEGLADSDGEGNRVNKLISTLVIILTVVEVVALIAFIVSKARKNKHR